MHTPIKYALGLLAIVAIAATPMSAAVDPDDLGRAVLHHQVGEGQALLGVANACNPNDPGTTVTTGVYNEFGSNSRPWHLIRAGDNGLFNACAGIFGGAYCSDPANAALGLATCEYLGEEGMPFRIVMNGIVPDGEVTNDDCSNDAPAFSTAVCGLYSHHADVLGGYACFYDATYTAIGDCVTDYDGYTHDLVGVVPAGAAWMLVGSGLDTFQVTSWFGCDDVYYAFTYGVNLCADPDGLEPQ